MEQKFVKCVDCARAYFFTNEVGRCCRRSCIQRTDLIRTPYTMAIFENDRVCEQFVSKGWATNEEGQML